MNTSENENAGMAELEKRQNRSKEMCQSEMTMEEHNAAEAQARQGLINEFLDKELPEKAPETKSLKEEPVKAINREALLALVIGHVNYLKAVIDTSCGQSTVVANAAMFIPNTTVIQECNRKLGQLRDLILKGA